MSNKKQQKHNVVNICKGNDPTKSHGTIIRITDDLPKELRSENPPENWRNFYVEEGEKLGRAILKSVPLSTIIVSMKYIHGVLGRIQNQNKGDKNEVN